MTGTVTWAGLDVHARSTHAAAINVMSGELVRARFGAGLEEPLSWLAGLPGPVKACYEAGPTGYGLYRAAAAAGIEMVVIAPGKTPRGPSDRVKTDQKDAELLARLLLAGSLTAVVVPPPELEAARDLMRAHDACRRDLMDARHRVSKLLLRHGRVYPEKATWTVRHRGWLGRQQFTELGTELAYADALACVDAISARKSALALKLSELALDERWWPTVARLRSFHGIDTMTAFALHLELGGDWARFQRAPQLASWLGLTPTLSQSGESSRQGHITKTGSTLARRLLVEAAWHYARAPGPGVALTARQAGQPAHVLQISHRARQRLHRTHKKMRSRGKPGNVCVVAAARELSCFLWAAAVAP
ncbi:MAG: IS110 family transposase [Actinomycetota bacterium]|nr:IS110 family transposase [Actinomycetota bacterium]